MTSLGFYRVKATKLFCQREKKSTRIEVQLDGIVKIFFISKLNTP